MSRFSFGADCFVFSVGQHHRMFCTPGKEKRDKKVLILSDFWVCLVSGRGQTGIRRVLEGDERRIWIRTRFRFFDVNLILKSLV